MKVQVALFKHNGPIASAIKWQTDSRYSHAALLFNERFLIESVGGEGVIGRLVQPEDLSQADVFDVLGIDEETAAVVFGFANGQVGKGYDYWGCARFISRRHLPENDRWFCSELVAESFKQAEYPLLMRVESWQVSPGDLAFSPKLSKAN